MDPAVDPFQPLLRLLQRYRRDVHQLRPPATDEALEDAEAALGHELPLALKGFYRRWNGGSLFRDALYLRATYELSAPAPGSLTLVTIADDRSGRSWAYGPDGQGGWVFGALVDGALVPQHDRFHRWLFGTLRVFDEGLREPREVLQARLECDPESGHLLLQIGEADLASGDPERALERFQQATAADPGLVRAWQRLGELQLAEGKRDQARFALLKALRATRLPAAFPGARGVEPGAIRALGRLFPEGDEGWEEELRRLAEERIRDVRDDDGLRLYRTACLERARVLMDRHDRAAARSALLAALERARAFARRDLNDELLLALASVETELGEHDEAERRLRALRDAEDPAVRARGALALGRIATLRQEPWAEDILAEALEGLEEHEERAHASLLLGTRHLQLRQLEQAEVALRAADAEAIRADDPGLQGEVCLGMGDLALAAGGEGAEEAADAALRAARERGIEGRDDQLLHRVLVRRGDARVRRGELAEAAGDYGRAIEGYQRMQLPLREAWCRVRLGSLQHERGEAHLRRAGEIFRAAGLAAGVAAVDEATGDPTRSLDWHLTCAAEHARARYEAQRARPPLTRADADRPERRLVAHRVAIAAGGDASLRALGEELERLARELEPAQARALDPNVTRFMAAADLVAYHRSYDAARLLLRLLFERRLPEVPTRALRSVLTRSPNAALVDGLLEAVESPRDPRGAALASEILGWRRATAAAPSLRALLSGGQSVPVRRAAVVALGRIGDRAAVPDLLPQLDEPLLAEDVAIALLLLGDRRGVDFHGQALAAGETLATPPGEIVGRYGGPAYLLLLLNTAGESSERAVPAIQGLGYLGDPRAVPKLIDALGGRDKARVRVAAGALELITGRREDPEEPGILARYIRWWEDAAPDFHDGSRYRYGHPVSPEVLAAQLSHDDPIVRRGAYDELVITTGAHLPFDADGPWRLQLAHRRAWLRWSRENAEHFPPGSWFFDGRPIG
jgi:HEAT repeat protein